MLTAISLFFSFFFFNDTATTEIYTLPLHAALPISARRRGLAARRDRLPEDDRRARPVRGRAGLRRSGGPGHARSEEHTSELQSRPHLVCRLLLEKKKRLAISCWSMSS